VTTAFGLVSKKLRPTPSNMRYCLSDGYAELMGKQPRSASILVEDYVGQQRSRCGILTADDTRRFGFHNLRHSLASFLISVGTNPKVVQGLLRHSDIHTTLQLYSQSVSADRLAAQAQCSMRWVFDQSW
jgi:integrase